MRRTLKLPILVALGAAFVACKSEPEGSAPSASATAAEAPIDVDGVNALVPSAIRDKLVFEKRSIVEERGDKTIYTVAAPKGWTQENKAFGRLRPPEGGIHLDFDVGTNCDGVCSPKDWNTTVEKVYASYLTGKVIKDEKREGGRTIVADILDGSARVVIVAWWKDKDDHYSHCNATLSGDLKDAAPAFERACQVVNVREE
jgi:hypothetical protein